VLPALPARYPPVPEPLGSGERGGVVDDHTHLDGLPDDEVDALLAAAAAAGVPRAVQIGCDLPAARWTVRAVERWPQLVGGVAIHPNEAPVLAARGELDAALAEVEALAAHPRVRVVGETGMDAYRTDLADPVNLEAQREALAWHVDLAKRLDRTLQIHDRDAHDLVLDVLEAEGAPERTVFHCFSGDADLARRCARNGWYLSFAGTVTFKNAHALREALRAVPLEQVQVETDAPYLTPVPHRGRPNASHLLPHTVRAVAAVLGRDTRSTADVLTRTAHSLYGAW
jgi:TatD DNase family protein